MALIGSLDSFCIPNKVSYSVCLVCRERGRDSESVKVVNPHGVPRQSMQIRSHFCLRLATVTVLQCPSLIERKSDKLCNPLRKHCQLSTELITADCVGFVLGQLCPRIAPHGQHSLALLTVPSMHPLVSVNILERECQLNWHLSTNVVLHLFV